MSTFNKLLAVLRCPSCKEDEGFLCEVRVGDRRQLSLVIGSEYPWKVGKAVHNGGRPPDGTMLVHCLAYCTKCETERFVDVEIVEDRIDGVAFSPHQDWAEGKRR